MAKDKRTQISNEYVDGNGERWVQTSADDLFSIRELNQIFDTVEKERDPDEIVLARIDFKTVNREYYETVQALQKSIRRKDELLKRLITESKRVIKRKNDMMFDMIEYIKQLQHLVAKKALGPEALKGIDPKALFVSTAAEDEDDAVYEGVTEIFLSEDGEEITSS